MLKFFKAQASSLTASAVDYLSTIIAVEAFKMWYVWASFMGNIIGGITNFTLGRIWVFKAKGEKVALQAVKYIMVWAGNIALNTGGVYLVTHYAKINYIISKVCVSLLVGFTYNYFLQKKFVFKY